MGDNYISCKAENGSINISEDVISTMVRTAITEIDGVAGISNTAGAELAELIGIKTVSKGIKVQIVDDTIKVDAVILVRYGCNIVNVAKEVQNSVTEAVQAITGIDKAEVNVEKVVDVLEGHQITLTKDIAVLDEMFKANMTNFKQLSLYIVAGKKKLEEVQNVTIPAMQAKAAETGAMEDAQAANDYANLANRFEKKLHDLDLTRTVSLQMGPQIRLIQNNDTLMVEKIQTTLLNTIPLWKSQMVLALGLAHSEQAMQAQKAVSDTTNELLKKNAELLKQTTVGVAQESERGIVDIETLKHTNQMLIDTLDEVVKIQNDGRAKRKAAEVELMNIETQLKDKMLEFRG